MSTDYHWQDFKPTPDHLDEGYWAALLNEDENPQSTHPDESHLNEIEGEPEYHVQRGRKIAPQEDWQTIRRHFEEDRPIELQCVGYNRGGLLAEWHNLRGFIPASQLIDFPATHNAHIRRNALLDRVGKMLTLRIIEFDEEKNRLILSERAAQAQPGERGAILQSLTPGDVVEGTVTNLCDFGAFVDLGGLEGLIHISELSWGRVDHPASILKRSETIRAQVLSVDANEGRIALSYKRLRPDPWKTVEDRYSTGQIVEGVITNVVDFGAFACIEDGLEGLIHVSELAESQFLHPRNVVSEGQSIQARILNINGKARRLGLSLRLNEQ